MKLHVRIFHSWCRYLRGRASERKFGGVRYESLHGLRIFSLSHAREKNKKHLSLFR